MSEIIVVKKAGEGLYEEKKSRFLARIYPIATEAEAQLHLEADRKKYWDARHNCYAYVIGDNNEITKCSDDGEPSQTAGKPILEVITGNGIHNCLVVVTRYFGGTLLGTGGLVRAYTKAAKDAVINCSLARMIPGIRYNITTDYNGIGKIQYQAAALGVNIVDTIYTDKVEIVIDVKSEDGEGFCKKITETTNGRAIIVKDCDLPIEEEYSVAD